MKNKILLCVFALFLAASFTGTWLYGNYAQEQVGTEVEEFFQNAEEKGGEFENYTFLKQSCFSEGQSDIEFIDFKEAPIVVRGKHNGAKQYTLDASVQEVVVEKAIKGVSEDLVGKTIKIVTPHTYYPIEKAMWGTYTNFMQKEHSYLIFLYNYGATFNDPEGIPTDEYYATSFASKFNYLDYSGHSDVTLHELLPEKEFKKQKKADEYRVSYSKLKSNEFFLLDNTSRELMYEKKAKIFASVGEQMDD